MNPRTQTRQNYDRLSRWYDLFASSERQFTESGLHDLDVHTGENALEIGFGTGHAIVGLAQAAGATGLVAGVELSPGMIAMAKKHVGVHPAGGNPALLNGDAAALPFKAHTFQAVFLSFTLELFAESEIPGVLGECRRALAPEGRLGVVAMARSNSLACRLYEWGHARWPALLDCRPIDVRGWLESSGFNLRSNRLKIMWGLPVAIVVAEVAQEAR